MNAVLVAAGGVYLAASVLLIAFGANISFLSFVVWRGGRHPEAEASSRRPLPRVTVQLPIYNELYVSERVIDAACRLDYPSELLQIQVLDDSTDETAALVAGAVDRARARGLDIVHVQRTERTGFKAGALQHGLASATGDLIAIFDADFVPEPSFLRRTVPYFDQEDVAFVQARWGHLNGRYSLLTRLQSLAIDGHFMVEQAARKLRGYWFNFNGTAGIWRAAAIEDAGGWTARTLTEDLDLSYRAHLRGWRGRYLRDLVVPGEVPAQMSGFRRQQHRWARGSLECALRLLPEIWRSSARVPVRFQATAHLTSYCIHLLLFTVTVLYPIVVLTADRYPGFKTFFGLAYPFALFSLAYAVFLVAGQRQQGRRWWRDVPRILGITVIGPGLMLNTVRAAVQIIARPDPEFERTAKFGMRSAEPQRTTWTRLRYQLKLDPIVYAETALGIYSLAAAWLAFRYQNWAIVLYATWFGVGLLAVAGLTVCQSLAVFRSRQARAEELEVEESAFGAAGTVR